MNNQAKIEAFKIYYQQAKELQAKEDFKGAREMFFKAASLANDISVESTSYNVKMEYHALAEKILTYLKESNNKKKENVVQSNDSNEDNSPFIKEEITEKNKVIFEDVAGLQDVKDEIIYSVIEPLKNPDLAKTYKIVPGAKILLYGPPGTGKTLIAKAIAGEIDAAFYAIDCKDLISKYMGDSSKRIDELFDEAQKNKRAIIFFDEFDSVASKREDGMGSVDAEMARFVATFLTKVDGFKKPDTCEMLLLIAATNRPWAIDPAMLRGGRFDTHIYVGLPDEEAIKFLVEKEFKDLPLEDNVDLNGIVQLLNGYGCADVIAICRKIKQLAYRKAVEKQMIVSISCSDVGKIISNSRIKYDIERFVKFRNGEDNDN